MRTPQFEAGFACVTVENFDEVAVLSSNTAVKVGVEPDPEQVEDPHVVFPVFTRNEEDSDWVLVA